MAIEYLKRALKTPLTGEDDTRDRVMEMLRDIETGEDRALHYLTGDDRLRKYFPDEEFELRA